MIYYTLSQRRGSGCDRKREAGREEGGRRRMRKKNGMGMYPGKREFPASD